MNILDLDLDFNVNVISPMWPESDFSLTDADTNIDADAILAFAETADLSFGVPASRDFIWDVNCVSTQNSENFYYDHNNDSSSLTPPINNGENVLESWQETDTCDFDALKDSLFELEVFGECLKEVDNQPETTTCSTMPICETSSITMSVDPIAEWNRRRSLLYDKNEFVQNDRLRERHGRPERQIKSTSTNTVPTTSIDQRTFRCSVRDCEKTYYKASHLKSHMRRHSGVKPFACDWDGCKWRFSRSDELARHKRSHSGIKPYSCNLCEKAFSRSDHLSKHAKVHMKKLALYGTPIITKKCNYKYLTVNRLPVE